MPYLGISLQFLLLHIISLKYQKVLGPSDDKLCNAALGVWVWPGLVKCYFNNIKNYGLKYIELPLSIKFYCIFH